MNLGQQTLQRSDGLEIIRNVERKKTENWANGRNTGFSDREEWEESGRIEENGSRKSDEFSDVKNPTYKYMRA
jgi:hypothetical protein